MGNRYLQDTFEDTNLEIEGIVCGIALNENIKRQYTYNHQ